jgi:hypothetical protein
MHGLSGLMNLLPLNLNFVPNTGHVAGIIETTYAAVMSHGMFLFFALFLALETAAIAQASSGLFFFQRFCASLFFLDLAYRCVAVSFCLFGSLLVEPLLSV